MKLTKEELEEVLNQTAGQIINRGLAAPAIFLLELYKPLSGVLINIGMLSYPLLFALTGMKNFEKLSALFGDSQSVELLIQKIEAGQGGGQPERV